MIEFPESHFLILSGPPRERGRMHGETLRGKIQELLQRWKDQLASTTKISPRYYVRELVAETNFVAAIERWTPGLLEEVRGISEGANVSFEELYAFQLQDEEWWFGQEKNQARQEATSNCSSIGRQGGAGSPSLVSQNMDMPDYLDGFQVVMLVRGDRSGVESLVFSAAGLLALNGLNDRSIGIVCNNLGQLNHSKEGLPVAYVHRGVLRRRSFAEAKAFLESLPHASGQNYLLGSPDHMVDLECSANQVAEYARPPGHRSLCHTNHPLVNTDFQRLPGQGTAPQEARAGFNGSREEDSRTRFEALFRRLDELEAGDVGPETAKKLLATHDSQAYPVCRHPGSGLPWMTLGTTIMILDEHPRLQVCPGPPCTSAFHTFSFRDQHRTRISG